jgi:hypothetical protein
MDEELDRFKRLDLLRQIAASIGFTIEKRESSRNSMVMRRGREKIIVTRKPDGHYTYWSPHDDKDHGTVIDFLAFRTGKNLGQIRMHLREWIGTGPPARPWLPELQCTPKDRLRVEMEFAKIHDAVRHPYLENERGIPAELLVSDRFAGRIRIDTTRQNAIFPHFDQDGICGFEKKNTAFRGFSSGGTKGLWLSHTNPEDERLVFCESAIDALSHALLFPDPHARYASVGGKLNPTQPELIRAAIARMPSGTEIVAAMDADKAGRDLAECVRRAFELSGRGDLKFRIHEPEGAKDWNDLLRARPSAPLPQRREEPSVA